jgi:hypothetical protein
MALIAPGAFLWLTFAEQALYGQPMAGIAMWFGILVALLLCLATAISYAEEKLNLRNIAELQRFAMSWVQDRE